MLQEQTSRGKSADNPPAPSSVSETCQSLGQKIDSIHVRIDGVFTRLCLILEVCMAVDKSMLGPRTNRDKSMSTVWFDSLYEQLGRLAAIVEELGRTCEYSGQPPLLGKRRPSDRGRGSTHG